MGKRSAMGKSACLSMLAMLVILSPTPAVLAAEEESFIRTRDVVYGRKLGMLLAMDVFVPKEQPNGAGVILVLSGGWISNHLPDNGAKPYLPIGALGDRGYAVFAVAHGSQPKFTIPEILEDMHRAVRFIRTHADEYGIDPDRIGIMGGSAGGHLSLMQGTAGKEGDATAADPVDRASSRVQAVACIAPPTDFLNYGRPGEVALGTGVLKNFKPPFDFVKFDPDMGLAGTFVPVTDEQEILEIGRQISPVNHVTPDDAPTLIIHGDADVLVPIQQAELILARFQDAGVEAELIVKKDHGHGWRDVTSDMELIADWFDKHLDAK